MKLKFRKSKIEEPKDLGIKIISKEEDFWTQVMTRASIQVESLEKELKLNKSILEMAESKLKNTKQNKI